MKSLRKSSNNAKKKTIETDTIIKIKILHTGNVLLHVFAETKLKCVRKTV